AKLAGLGGLIVIVALVAVAVTQRGHEPKAGMTVHASRAAHTSEASRASRASAVQRRVTPRPSLASPARVVTSAGPTVAASGGGPGATVEDLSALSPVQAFNVSGVRSGPVRIGAVTYADSVRFTCDSGGHDSSGDLDYVVTGYGSMSATVGVPDDGVRDHSVPGDGVPSGDMHGAGDAATVAFFDNGSGPQASQPLTVSPGHP